MRPALPAFAALLSSCIVYADGAPPTDYGQPPAIDFADGSCYFDEARRDFTWWFEAEVHDDRGPGNVVAVYADVYDDWDGSLADSFELYRDNAAYWYAEWDQASTGLDCEYYDYTVEFVAYDTDDWTDAVSFEMY
jgi:hypothetical protein